MSIRQKVSVIIPNFNYARFLSEAIESVFDQSHKDIELIIVDNGSTDNSLEILKPFNDRITLVNQANLGQASARNAGLRHITGDFVAFLDADDYWESDKLEKQLQRITKDNELVYSGISRFRDRERKVVSVVTPSYSGDCSQFFLTSPGVSIVLSGESTTLFSRALLERVGLFDENLNSASGWDFFRRCSKFTKFDFVPEPLTNYRLHASNMSNSSINTIEDIRRAYKKIFSDRDWAIDPNQAKNISRTLEITFLKTYIKEYSFKLACRSIMSIMITNRWKSLQTSR